MARTLRRRDEQFKDWFFENRVGFERETQRAASNPTSHSSLFVRRWVKGAKTYQGFLEMKRIKLHSDSGQALSRNAMRKAPSAFTNVFCERPLRRAHRQQILTALKSGSEDNLVLEPFMKNAAYAYW